MKRLCHIRIFISSQSALRSKIPLIISTAALYTHYRNTRRLITHAQNVYAQANVDYQEAYGPNEAGIILARERLKIVSLVEPYVVHGCSSGLQDRNSYRHRGQTYPFCGANVPGRLFKCMVTISGAIRSYMEAQEIEDQPNAMQYGL